MNTAISKNRCSIHYFMKRGMVMYYQETEKVSLLYSIAIFLWLIGAFIAGILAGKACGWGIAGISVMIAVWLSDALVALLLYTKKCQFEMLDDIAGMLKKIEEKTKQAEISEVKN